MGTPGNWQGQPSWPPSYPAQGYPAQGYPDTGAQYQTPYPPQYQPMPPPMPRPSPFAGVPRTDLLLDGSCVVALIMVLVFPWNVVGRGYNRIEVIVSLVLALVALVLPYVSRMGMFGPAWGPAQVRRTKIVLAAPLALCAAGYFVADAALGVIDGQATQYAPAAGAWIAVAAATLTAVPRRSDLIDPAAPATARLWGAGLTAAGVAMLVGAVLAVLAVSVGVYRARATAIEVRALVVWPAAQAILLALWVLAVFFVVRRAARADEAARLTLGATGAGALVWAILSGFIQFGSGSTESVHLPFAAIALTMIVAVVALAPSLANPQARLDARVWLAAAGGALKLIVVVNVLLLAQVVIAVLLTGALTAVVFTTAACAGLGAIAADWARHQLSLGALAARLPVVAAASLQAFCGLILIVLTGHSSNSWETITAPQVIATAALPAAAAAFLLLPAPVRALYPSPAPPPMYPYPAPPNPAPVDPTPATVYTPIISPADPTVYTTLPPVEPTVVTPLLAKPEAPKATERAANPATPTQELWELAHADQSVWPFLAANPAAPPDLLSWLAQSTDPDVRASLRARGL